MSEKMVRYCTIITVTLFILFSLVSVTDAGDACCKAEAAKRGLIADPFAVKPTNWDDEDDGPWEAPKKALVDLPIWYRFFYETRLGLIGAAPWLITGVISAALLTTIVKPLVPSSTLRLLLGSNTNGKLTRGKAVIDSIRGSIFGLLVPFCSCGALPLAMALKQEGISSSSIAAFVTAAQAAGIDSLFFTYGIFGAHVAILRLTAAGFLAFLVGVALGSDVDNIEKDTSKTIKEPIPSDNGPCCGKDGTTEGGCHDKKPQDIGPINISLVVFFVNTAVELFSSVAVWVFLGVVISAVASIWAPPTSAAASANTSSATFLSLDMDAILVMKSIANRTVLFSLSLPMTICEHGIVSLANSLRDLGFSAGTAVSLIVTGPSTNAGTLLMLSRLNGQSSGKRKWFFDATKMISVILLFGVTLSFLADDLGQSIMTKQSEMAGSGGGGSSLPEWLDQNAVSLAGIFTVLSIVQSSSLLFHSTS